MMDHPKPIAYQSSSSNPYALYAVLTAPAIHLLSTDVNEVLLLEPQEGFTSWLPAGGIFTYSKSGTPIVFGQGVYRKLI